MRKFLGGIFAAAVAVMVVVSVASGSSSKSFTAHLTAGQETPKASAPAGATGTFKATLTGTTLKWTLTYSHLSGTAQQAHIHLGKKGVAGNVAIVICSSPAQCKSPSRGSMKNVPASVIKALGNGGAYVNIHTAKNPNGEIRGQIM